MLVWLIISIVIGGIVAALTGLGFMFLVVSIGLFILGLPGLLIWYFIYGIVSYNQDREDYRELMRQLDEDCREEERYERYLLHRDYLEDKRITNSYNIDARSIHYHKHPKPRRTSRSKPQPESRSEPPLRDEKGRFIKKK